MSSSGKVQALFVTLINRLARAGAMRNKVIPRGASVGIIVRGGAEFRWCKLPCLPSARSVASISALTVGHPPRRMAIICPNLAAAADEQAALAA